MAGMGFSYQPGGQDTQFYRQRGQGGQGSAPQQAIRTLSLRVPQEQGPRGISPLPLLNAGGGGGSDLDMLLMALMKAFGQGGGQSFSGRRPQSANAAPRIIPGIDDPTGGGQQGPQQMPRTIPNDFPVPGNPTPQPLPPPEFSQGDFLNRVPGGGIGNTGRPRGMVEPLF